MDTHIDDPGRTGRAGMRSAPAGGAPPVGVPGPAAGGGPGGAGLVEMLRAVAARGDRHWQDRANCLGVDPDLFFPERGASTREAKSVCAGCEVRLECLEYALANGEKFGIWGGLSERERRRLRRQRALARKAGAGV